MLLVLENRYSQGTASLMITSITNFAAVCASKNFQKPVNSILNKSYYKVIYEIWSTSFKDGQLHRRNKNKLLNCGTKITERSAGQSQVTIRELPH